MLTIDLLYAILQGLPPQYTEFLPNLWSSFCRSIHRALQNGNEPPLALIIAFERAGWKQNAVIQNTLRELLFVMHLADLSRREKEALAALRVSKAASLSQLSSILQQDRSNTFRRLNSLVKKGYALKFFQPTGVFYMAIARPLDKHSKLAVNHILETVIKDSAESVLATTPTTLTTPTTPTTLTTPTTPTMPTTPTPPTMPTTSTSALLAGGDPHSPFSNSVARQVHVDAVS